MSDQEKKKWVIISISDDVQITGSLQLFCQWKMCWICFEEEPIKIKWVEELHKKLAGKKYDYLILQWHGNGNIFWRDSEENISWWELWTSLCTLDCLNDWATLLLYCCRWWLEKVWFKLFSTCDKIQYICWATQNMNNIDLTLWFSVFLYNSIHRKIDPILAAEKATIATMYRFRCYDRDEIESNPIYFNFYCPDCYDKEPDWLTE